MAKIDLPKRSGKRSKVREKSVKSQGILKMILNGNPEQGSGIDTIKYHTCPRITNGKVTKSQ